MHRMNSVPEMLEVQGQNMKIEMHPYELRCIKILQYS